MKNKRFFPMFVDLTDKKILVVGGGNIATRRIKTLLQFTRNITVVAPKITLEIRELGKAGFIHVETRPVRYSDFKFVYMVISATSDRKLDDDIYRYCQDAGIYVNVASDKEKCDFYFPGVVIQDEAVVGITASGMDHTKAKRIREKIQKSLKEAAEEAYYDE